MTADDRWPNDGGRYKRAPRELETGSRIAVVGKAHSPPWKGGVAAPSNKRSRSFAGAAGVVGSTSDNRGLNLPPRLRPLRRLRSIFLGAQPPLLSKEGSSPFPSVLNIHFLP